MQHKKGYRKLGRDTAHRISMLNNMVSDMILYGGITTTTVKAKTLRPYLERVITKIKNNSESLAVVREFNAILRSEQIVKKAFSFVKSSLSGRKGGYTRITKLCHRKSDGSSMAKIEFVDFVNGQAE